MQFSDSQIQRYSRHLILPEVGLEGQKKIRSSSILCIGAGGLGSVAAIYLSAAGIGRLGIVDFDSVDISNLQRQIIHTTANIGMPKTDSAKKTINTINPDVEVDLYRTRLSQSNAYEIIKNYDVILDCSDNFATRYLINDVCANLKKPFIYGAVFQFEGQVTVFSLRGDSPCYRCFCSEPPPAHTVPSCAESGVFCIVPGIIGLIQANEALKLILGIGSVLHGRLLTFDALNMKFKEIQIKRDPECPICSGRVASEKFADYEQKCESQIESVQKPLGIEDIEYCEFYEEDSLQTVDEISTEELNRVINSPSSDIVILDVRENDELRENLLPRSLHIPLSVLRTRLNELNPSNTYYIVCQFGIRSKMATQILKFYGFKNVKHLEGGLTNYLWHH